jgi:hypothetical protein
MAGDGYLHRTFEYVPVSVSSVHAERTETLFARRDPDIDDAWAWVEIRITFFYSPGTERSHPGGHYNRASETWDPTDADEAEYLGAERQDGDKWVPIPETDWLHGWCRAAYDAADGADFSGALPERDDD